MKKITALFLASGLLVGCTQEPQVETHTCDSGASVSFAKESKQLTITFADASGMIVGLDAGFKGSELSDIDRTDIFKDFCRSGDPDAMIMLIRFSKDHKKQPPVVIVKDPRTLKIA